MGILRSLSFGQCNGLSELPDETVEIFARADESERVTDYAYDIAMKGVRGDIYKPESFNIRAYERAVREKEVLRNYNLGKKFCSITNTEIDDEKRQKGEVTEEEASAAMVNQVADAFEEVLNDEEVRFAVACVKSLNEDFMVTEGLDLLACIRSALGGIKPAVDRLRKVCADYAVVGEYIKVILEDGRPFEELFAGT